MQREAFLYHLQTWRSLASWWNRTKINPCVGLGFRVAWSQMRPSFIIFHVPSAMAVPSLKAEFDTHLSEQLHSNFFENVKRNYAKRFYEATQKAAWNAFSRLFLTETARVKKKRNKGSLTIRWERTNNNSLEENVEKSLRVHCRPTDVADPVHERIYSLCLNLSSL